MAGGESDAQRASPAMPSQQRAWNAYGHAMGAALGLEVSMRACNFERRFKNIVRKGGSPKNIGAQMVKLRDNGDDGTFGQVARQFLDLHPELVEIDAVLTEAVSNAADFRNYLAHGFLLGHVGHLTTEHGLDIMVTESQMYRAHFEELEGFLQLHRSDAIQGFLSAALKAFESAPPHPLSAWVNPEVKAPADSPRQ